MACDCGTPWTLHFLEFSPISFSLYCYDKGSNIANHTFFYRGLPLSPHLFWLDFERTQLKKMNMINIFCFPRPFLACRSMFWRNMKNENVTLQFNKREYIMTQVVITFTRQPHENIPIFHNYNLISVNT